MFDSDDQWDAFSVPTRSPSDRDDIRHAMMHRFGGRENEHVDHRDRHGTTHGIPRDKGILETHRTDHSIALSLMVAGSGTAANASQVAQVESTTFEADDGTYSVQVDRNAHSATVIAPDGEVSTFGPNSAIWDAEHTELPAPSAPGNTITDASSTACTWAIYAVSIIHSAGWAGLLAAAAVNPALAFIVLMGQGAFWTWLGTNC